MTRRARGSPKAKLQADQRRKRMPGVIKEYLQGKSPHDIAIQYGVTRGVIYRDLTLARKIWRKRIDRSSSTLVGVELAKIDNVEREAWEQWERSKKDAEEETIEEGADGKPTGKTKKRKGQTGEAAYLKIILECIDHHPNMLAIGQYSTEKGQALVAKLIEVVVDNASQIPAIMNYGDYENMVATGTVDAVSTEEVSNPDIVLDGE